MCWALNYFRLWITFNIVLFLFLLSVVVFWFLHFASLVGIPVAIVSSGVWLKMYAITTEIKKYKPTVQKKMKKHDKIKLLAETKLNNIEFLTSKALIESCVKNDKFVSGNNMLREYNEMKIHLYIAYILFCRSLDRH